MVRKESFVYLFTGLDIIAEDGLSKKDTTLKKIKERFLPKTIEDFNLDVLYARELNLKDLQERLLSFPVKTKKRIIVIKEVQNLKEEIKEFILKYVKKPLSSIILVLDIDRQDPKDRFIKGIYNYVQVHHFREPAHLDAFTLGRAIDLKRSEYALKILNQLLEKGERPEWILGGLRYVWERSVINPFEIRKRLKLLLNCDIDIKTGRLKASFALERLVVNLCSLTKPFC